MPQAVIFDLDGTLLDSLEDLADSANAALAASGYPVHPVAAYRDFVGDGMAMLVRRALPPEGHKDLEAVLANMRREYAVRWKMKSLPYPGVPEALDALTARGVPLAVVSNKPDAFTKQIVTGIFGRWPFAAAVGEGPGVPCKPDPAGALAVARQLGLAPAAFLFVGDSPMDVQTALAAGMAPVGVTWGFREKCTLAAAGATVFIDRAEELLDLI